MTYSETLAKAYCSLMDDIDNNNLFEEVKEELLDVMHEWFLKHYEADYASYDDYLCVMENSPYLKRAIAKAYVIFRYKLGEYCNIPEEFQSKFYADFKPLLTVYAEKVADTIDFIDEFFEDVTISPQTVEDRLYEVGMSYRDFI